MSANKARRRGGRTRKTDGQTDQHQIENESLNQEEEAKSNYSINLKDLFLLGTLATFTASGLTLSLGSVIYGYEEFLDKCWALETSKFLMGFLTFAIIIGMLTYAFARMAAHFMVYVGIGILLSILMPANPGRVKRVWKQLFDKANT